MQPNLDVHFYTCIHVLQLPAVRRTNWSLHPIGLAAVSSNQTTCFLYMDSLPVLFYIPIVKFLYTVQYHFLNMLQRQSFDKCRHASMPPRLHSRSSLSSCRCLESYDTAHLRLPLLTATGVDCSLCCRLKLHVLPCPVGCRVASTASPHLPSSDRQSRRLERSCLPNALQSLIATRV